MARGNKYRPMWKQGVWLGRHGADQDVIATAPQTITKTRSVRKTTHEWVAEDILAIEIGPWNASSRLESKLRAQPLRGLLPRHIPDADRDLDAEAVAGIPDSASETESQLCPTMTFSRARTVVFAILVLGFSTGFSSSLIAFLSPCCAVSSLLCFEPRAGSTSKSIVSATCGAKTSVDAPRASELETCPPCSSGMSVATCLHRQMDVGQNGRPREPQMLV